MRRAMPYPCNGPSTARVCRTITSSVPCKRSSLDSPIRLSCGSTTYYSSSDVVAPQEIRYTSKGEKLSLAHFLLCSDWISPNKRRRIRNPLACFRGNRGTDKNDLTLRVVLGKRRYG